MFQLRACVASRAAPGRMQMGAISISDEERASSRFTSRQCLRDGSEPTTGARHPASRAGTAAARGLADR